MKKSFNSRLVIIFLLIVVLMSFVVYAAITVTQSSPLDGATSTTRSINFTFTPVWAGGEAIGNCSLFTNISGTWEDTKTNDSTGAEINNNSLSWINYTFDADYSLNWSIRCQNATNLTVIEGYSANRTLTIDTTGPTITLVTPNPGTGNQTVSTFTVNFTVSSDTASCSYQVNGSSAVSLTPSGTTCLGTEELSFKNLDGGYNITFNATDNVGNAAGLVFYLNVSDNAAPDDGTSVATSSITSNSAIVTVSNVNESVNITVHYGITNTALSSSADSTAGTFSTTPTATLTGLSLNTLYHYNFTLCDYNGNCITNSTVYNFTTIKKSDGSSCTSNSQCIGGYCCDDECSSSSCPTTTSSGSSGGGVAAPKKATSIIEDSQSKMWSDVTAGSSFSLDVDKTNIAITKVTVSANKDLSNTELKVSSLKENPVSYEAGEKTYQYLEIGKKNIKDEDFDESKIRFRVQNNWLSENNLNKDDIALYKYEESEWNMLETKQIAGNGGYSNYEAITSGFSYFAIASKSSGPEKETPESTTAQTTDSEKEETKSTTDPAATPISEKQNSFKGLIIFLVIVVLGAGAYYFVMNKDKFIKKKKK